MFQLIILCLDRHFYSFICVKYFKCSDTYAIFFWQLVNKTADYFNNIVFILVVKISSKKVSENNGKQLNVGRGLTSVQQERWAVAVSRSNFWFQSGFPQKDEEEKCYNSENFAENKFAIFCFICLSWLTFGLSNINWMCLENCNTLTERAERMIVLDFKFFLNILL